VGAAQGDAAAINLDQLSKYLTGPDQTKWVEVLGPNGVSVLEGVQFHALEAQKEQALQKLLGPRSIAGTVEGSGVLSRLGKEGENLLGGAAPEAQGTAAILAKVQGKTLAPAELEAAQNAAPTRVLSKAQKAEQATAEAERVSSAAKAAHEAEFETKTQKLLREPVNTDRWTDWARNISTDRGEAEKVMSRLQQGAPEKIEPLRQRLSQDLLDESSVSRASGPTEDLALDKITKYTDGKDRAKWEVLLGSERMAQLDRLRDITRMRLKMESLASGGHGMSAQQTATELAAGSSGSERGKVRGALSLAQKGYQWPLKHAQSWEWGRKYLLTGELPKLAKIVKGVLSTEPTATELYKARDQMRQGQEEKP
jgi:hypothetical protein